MAHQLLSLPRPNPLNASGLVTPGARLRFYLTGTTTATPVYTTSELSVAHTQPVEADATGRLPAIYMDPTIVYKMTFSDSADVLQYTVDPVNDQILSQAVIGGYLYPRTTSEISAGVTPVNYAYPPGHIRRYGAVCDGTTDDTSALQTAATLCETSGIAITDGGLVGTCKVTSTITLNCTGSLGSTTFSAASASVTPVVLVGVTSGGPTQLNGALRLPKVTNSSYVAGSGWTGFNVGVEFANLYQSQIHVPLIQGFRIGIHAGGYTEGFSYNVILFEMISSNKIGLRLEGKNTNGWANQNVFIGGRFFIPSSEGSAISGSRHIQLVPNDVTVDDVSWPNNNTFINPSVEGDGPEWPLSCSGNNNKFINVRFEATSPKMLFLGHASVTKTYENHIDCGYDSRNMSISTSGLCFYNGVTNPRGSSYGGDGVCLNLRSEGSSADPAIQCFAASEAFLNATSSASNWSSRFGAQKLLGKASASGATTVDIDFPSGVIKGGQMRVNDNATGAASTVTFGVNTQTTVGSAGAASALPANPTGYLRFFVGTTEYVLPYYARA